ncbi:hypothetical protein [Microcoleus sp. B9-D4]|uniref:hypothetical protein n=1 Tax=Microcoleus sp. B9-D4 TaxID=2818711 RepID=UPI002FCE8DDF
MAEVSYIGNIAEGRRKKEEVKKALHNCGMILIVLWDGISSPEGVYFHSRLDG